MKNLLLIITIQRSGSTLLFDLLRYHPCFFVENTWSIYKQMEIGENRRRYPKDLSYFEGPEDHLIEVIPNKWVYMEKLIENSDEKVVDRKIFIEKIHPHFFNFSIKKIENLERKFDLKVLLVTRKPSESIDSFLRYQKRNPNWYSGYSIFKTIIHYIMELNYIYKMRKNKKISIETTTYESLIKNPERVIRKIEKFCECEYNGTKENVRKILSNPRKTNVFQSKKSEEKNYPKYGKILRFLMKKMDNKYKKFRFEI